MTETTNGKDKKVYQYVFDYFAEQILTGQVKIGDKVLTERELSEKLDVSRNSIREVMHMLEINGLLDCRQGSGNYIRCEPQDYMVKFINMVMSLQNIKYTEIYDIRMGYETAALRLAIDEASDEELMELYNILVEMDQIDDPAESAKLDIAFHNCLVEASHNRLIQLYYSMLALLMEEFIKDLRARIMADATWAEELRLSHWDIYRALVTKDFVAGSIAMQRHFAVVGERLRAIEREMNETS